ncbi:MAG: hypothetical protein DI527_00445 [Chelatococcus sp.]|nr:MAG: hypothetical protein DI527_00445 [Chelatococcus sp.]
MRTRDVDLRLRDGTLATVEFTIAPAEPDVGIFGDYAEEWWLTHLNDRTVARSNTCYRREIEERMLALEIEHDDPFDYLDWS